MINLDDRQQLHQFIVFEFTVRTLEHDYPFIEQLKTRELYLPLHNALLQEIRKEYYRLKRYFKQKHISIIGWQRVDTYFSDIHIATAGNDEVFRYANQALKKEVEELLGQRIEGKLQG